MTHFNRRTLTGPATVRGVGLFTGAPVNLELRPAESGAGIQFVRDDNPTYVTIDHLSHEPIHPAFAMIPPRHTCLGAADGLIATVEHVLGALAGLGITDAEIHIDGPEIPIDDGSARCFIEAITSVGIRDLDDTLEPVVVRDTIEVTKGESFVRLEPSDTVHYEYSLDYSAHAEGASIGAQTASWNGDHDAFAKHVAPARTFSMKSEAELMASMGLFSHLTPRDMLVIGPDGPIDNDWRMTDEPAHHKLLDLIGDLALVGRPILASISASRAGHALNHEAAKRVVAQCAV